MLFYTCQRTGAPFTQDHSSQEEHNQDHLAGEVGDEIEEYNDRNLIELLLVMVFVTMFVCVY